MAQKGHTHERLRRPCSKLHAPTRFGARPRRGLPANSAVLYSFAMEAEMAGSQRKVVVWSVTPRDPAPSDADIALRDGRTLPFVVTRSWSAPAGLYAEQWFLVEPESREVLFESEVRETAIWGLQSLTEIRDEVLTAVELSPGPYLVVFSLGGVKGGEMEVQAAERPAEEAA
jgi:hypothetical protein